MSMPCGTPSIRLRRTPFTRRVEAAGVKAYTVYNHMLLPSFFTTPEEDYRHLKSAVQVWDVSVERQVEVVGPDALRLVQMTTPRDMSRMADDQCYYIPMVDTAGKLMNDPVAIRLNENRYWLSLADSDMLLYCKGLAAAGNLNVDVFEPDVSPLAIQGPKADTLAARVFGEDVVKTKFFRHTTINFEGQDMVLARSGWSHQGGFELYLQGSEYGEAVWDALFAAGEDLDVRAGCPNLIERIEAGLLSFGSDITTEHTPFEAGLTKYCNLDTVKGFLGHEALSKQAMPTKQIRALAVNGDPVPSIQHPWPLLDDSGEVVGHISSSTWSPEYETNVTIAMVNSSHWNDGVRLTAKIPDADRGATVRGSFWI
jgi:dimethylsulfoniopropionate demethylase